MNNLSGRAMDPGLPQPQTNMSTRNKAAGAWG